MPTDSQPAQIDIRAFKQPEDTSDLHRLWEENVASLHGAYSLPAEKFLSLVTAPLSKVFVATASDNRTVGFALTYLMRSGSTQSKDGQHYKGALAALVVDSNHRGQGVGSALHAAALSHLETTVRQSFQRSTPPPAHGDILLGSFFPRIFPGIPALPGFEGAKSFFAARGWQLPGSHCIDLYGRLPTSVDLKAFLDKPHSHGIEFRPAREEDREALMEMEYREFGSFPGWPDMFPVFLDAGRASDIHLAIDKQGSIIGATFAALPGSPLHAQLVWPDTLGKACGAVACVGVSKATRGEGAGVGLCASALLDLTARGADGCFIDWVSMDGFYERFGVEKWEGAYWDGGRSVDA